MYFCLKLTRECFDKRELHGSLRVSIFLFKACIKYTNVLTFPAFKMSKKIIHIPPPLNFVAIILLSHLQKLDHVLLEETEELSIEQSLSQSLSQFMNEL